MGGRREERQGHEKAGKPVLDRGARPEGEGGGDAPARITAPARATPGARVAAREPAAAAIPRIPMSRKSAVATALIDPPGSAIPDITR